MCAYVGMVRGLLVSEHVAQGYGMKTIGRHHYAPRSIKEHICERVGVDVPNLVSSLPHQVPHCDVENLRNRVSALWD